MKPNAPLLPTPDSVSETPSFLTVKQAAQMMQVSDRTIRRWSKEGLKVVKVGQVTRIHHRDLEDFVNGQQDVSSPKEWAEKQGKISQQNQD